MEGAFEKLMANWPTYIRHNHKGDPDKELRYRVGEERLGLLREYAEYFAYRNKNGIEYVAYLFEVCDDRDARMSDEIKYEYLCGSIDAGEFFIFSYIWFHSLKDAKEYASRHNMRIQGGWNEE